MGEFVGDQHDTEETLKLFANTDIVVAPHGAALAFIMGMKPGGAVVEIAYE